jgi:hypothetical protein
MIPLQHSFIIAMICLVPIRIYWLSALANSNNLFAVGVPLCRESVL